MSVAPNTKTGAPSAMAAAPNRSLTADCSSFVTKTAPNVSTAAAAVKMLAVDAELNTAMHAAHPAAKRNRGGAYRATLARESSPYPDRRRHHSRERDCSCKPAISQPAAEIVNRQAPREADDIRAQPSQPRALSPRTATDFAYGSGVRPIIRSG
jgi:hypothetical protein